MGANAIAAAMRMPPQAIKGIAYDTPVNKCCRSFCAISYTETLSNEYPALHRLNKASRTVDKKHFLD